MKNSLLYAMLLLFPLFCYPHGGIFGVLIGKFYGLLILAAFALVFLAFEGKKIRTLEEKLLLVFLILALLSTCFAGNKRVAFFGATFRYDGFISLFSYGVVFVYCSRHGKLSHGLLFGMLLVGMVISFIGFAQFLHLSERYFKPFKGRAYGLMGNPDFYGSYLCLLIPLALYWFLERKFITGLVLFTTFFAALGSSMTRGSWIGAAAGILFFLFFYFLQGNKKEKLKRVLILFLTVLLLFGSVYFSNQKIRQRVLSIFSDLKTVVTKENLSGLANKRGLIWKQSYDLAVKNPLLGVGQDNMIFALDQKTKKVKLDKAHNEYLDRALSTGIPSLLVYLGFLGLVMLKGIKTWKDPLTLALLSSVVAYLVQAFFNIAVVMVYPYFMAILGLLYHRSNQEELSA